MSKTPRLYQSEVCDECPRGMGVDLETYMRRMLVLYRRQVKGKLWIYLGLMISDYGDRTQNLAIVLHNSGTGRFFPIKLSSMRKVIKILTKWKFVPDARQLTATERMKLEKEKYKLDEYQDRMEIEL